MDVETGMALTFRAWLQHPRPVAGIGSRRVTSAGRCGADGALAGPAYHDVGPVAGFIGGDALAGLLVIDAYAADCCCGIAAGCGAE
jgi:hypothetical protein